MLYNLFSFLILCIFKNFRVDKSGFAYWTDNSTGSDVFFNDGGSGTFWSWGPLNVQPQNASIFNLPANKDVCEKLCATEEIQVSDPMVNLARKFYKH
jgi:hypothetical protein